MKPKPRKPFRFSRAFYIASGGVVFLGILALLPTFFLSSEAQDFTPYAPEPFPVTVDPERKLISGNPSIEAILSENNFSLTSAALNTGDFVYSIAAAVASAPLYRMLAAGTAPNIVRVEPGYRREEVAEALGGALRWNKTGKDAFLKSTASAPSFVLEGRIPPGVYVVENGVKTPELATMFAERFERNVLSRYSTTTEEIVPLKDTLTIASMIERETSDKDEMRVISGIIWNRIFAGMRLQIDATLQYAKATGRNGWWPVVRSRDKYISSPYNTYQNAGLPPGPISNPSVAAILAALNPIKTACIYYFHDAKAGFHCSATYEEHVKLLKQYYGRGK